MNKKTIHILHLATVEIVYCFPFYRSIHPKYSIQNKKNTFDKGSTNTFSISIL